MFTWVYLISYVYKTIEYVRVKIEDIICDPELSSRYWIVRKAACLVGYYGGLRNIELRSIEFGKIFDSGEKSFDADASGYWFSFFRGKQRGIPEISSFCVPRRMSDWAPTVSSADQNPIDYDPASVIDHYVGMVEMDLNCTRDKLTGSFFKSAHGKNGKFFRNVPMGKNLLEKIGHEFADELMLLQPHTYTGHCWRRSCGTNASDAGVNVTTLMAHFGWSTPKTAIGYVKKSRMTSYNMLMFLSNVQRQDRDIESILNRTKPLIGGGKGSVNRQKSSGVKSKEKVTVIVPNVNEKMVSIFSSSLASAKPAETVCRTRESEIKAAENRAIVAEINENPGLNTESSTGTSVANQIDLSGQNDVGGGDNNDGEVRVSGLTEGGGGSVNIDATSVLLDPRVASILSNLSNHGQLQVHFHFGGK